VVFTPHQLQELVGLYGADHLLIGTDYLYDMADVDSIGLLCAAFADAETVAAICGGNAHALIG
jgi:aminocarboxymuconate-semialdehyde decarboxylase